MIKIRTLNPVFSANKKELLKKARLENYPDLLKEFGSFFDKFASLLNPKAVFFPGKVSAVNNGTSTISDVSFYSPILARFLTKGETVFPFIATCGTELENVDLTDMDYMAPFWIDYLKESALQVVVDLLKDKVSTDNNIQHLSSMSPGSADANVWDIREQQQLFSFFGDTKKLLGVTLTPSYLMVPNKTVSGILFPTNETISDCRFCTRAKCDHRKEACEHALLMS